MSVCIVSKCQFNSKMFATKFCDSWFKTGEVEKSIFFDDSNLHVRCILNEGIFLLQIMAQM